MDSRQKNHSRCASQRFGTPLAVELLPFELRP
jgi:hypothetical protein